MVIVTTVALTGQPGQLLRGDASRVGLIFFGPLIGNIPIGPLESLTVSGAMFLMRLQTPLIIKLRDYGEILGWEWWHNSTVVGSLNVLEVLRD